jgi:hypothetical protein
MPALFAGDQQEKDMSYLIGKFVLVDSGESYRTGEIVTTLDDHYFMVRFDNMMEKVPAKSTTLVCLHEMSATYGDEEFKSWHFFDTRADLQGYVEWLDAPAEAAEVVKLVKPSTKKTAH